MDFSFTIALAALIAGLSKGGILGPTGGALVVPLLVKFGGMEVAPANGITVQLFIIADVLAMRLYWKQWDMHYIRLLIPMTIVGVFVGTFFLANLSDDILRPLLGFMTLLVVIYKLTSEKLTKIEYKPQNWHGYFAGWVGGFGSSVANVGGPPITAYLLFQKLKPMTFVGTATLYFFILNLAKVPGYISTDVMQADLLVRMIWALPIVVMGVWLGRYGIQRFDTNRFDTFMTILVLTAALMLLFE